MSSRGSRWLSMVLPPTVALAGLYGCGTTPTFSGGLSGRAAHQLHQGSNWAPDEGRAGGGAGIDIRWHLLASRQNLAWGLALGLEEAWMPVPSRSWRGRRENLLVSWSQTPRQDGYACSMGWELTLVPAGWGNIRAAGDLESAYTAGARLGGLLRLPCWNKECSESLYAGRALLVLQLGLNEHHPIDAPNAPSWIGEGLATLGLRYDVSVLP